MKFRAILIVTLSSWHLFACQEADKVQYEQEVKNTRGIGTTLKAEQIFESKSQVSRPNILLITVDDLGYSDLGAFGSEIATPNIDALIKSGVMLTDFHTAPTCSPTRSMLMSGTDNHLAGLGIMAESRVKHPEIASKPGYEGHLNDRVVALPHLLQDVGYRTYITGKWHLGVQDHSSPKAKGFDRSFVLLDGGAGSFDDLGIMAVKPKATYRENGEIAEWPKGAYTTQFYSEKMIEYLAQDKESDAPFFAFLSYTSPHWPLQAPDEAIAKYEGRYDAGYEYLFEQRLKNQKALGLVGAGVVGQPLHKGELSWNELSEMQKKVAAKKMEIYAAMIDEVDVYLGQVIQSLKDSDDYDNTVIFFMSDNGAQAGDTVKGLEEHIANCCDNRYENMGKADSYLFTGPNWARASTGPSRLYKGFSTEGGIRAPAFISYPKRQSDSQSKGKRYTGFLSVLDLLPTFLELAGAEHPGTEYKGKPVYPAKGKSLISVLDNVEVRVHSDDYVMGWELYGRRALRQGDWKIIATPPPEGNSQWELFNVVEDPTELNDLSKEKPELFSQMLRHWKTYIQSNGVQNFGDSFEH